MLLALEGVCDIPIIGSDLAGRAGTSLNVLGIYLRTTTVPRDVGAYRGTVYSHFRWKFPVPNSPSSPMTIRYMATM
jgi:hypothetical protein